MSAFKKEITALLNLFKSGKVSINDVELTSNQEGLITRSEFELKFYLEKNRWPKAAEKWQLSEQSKTFIKENQDLFKRTWVLVPREK